MSDGISPPREEVWRRFAEEIGARYIVGDLWQPEQVIARMEPWTVTMEPIYDPVERIQVTRLTAGYLSTEQFIFAIFRPNVSPSSGLLSHTKPVETGDTVFDAAFCVTASDAGRVRELLANPHLRQYLLSESQIRLDAGVYPNFSPSSRTQLTCIVPGVIEAPARLLTLFELMGETLQHLRFIGSASDRDPATTG